MKPSFALNLSHDGISLLHRAQSGWLSVGDVPLESPNLMDDLIYLRRTAADLDAQGLSTKLVIPNSQILYMDIEAPGPTKAERMTQIREALVQRTPYAEDDLVIDWRPKSKNTVQVAVVSRETLTEAETFATRYRFNPVSFVAIPPSDAFEGEPFFGPTRHADRFLDRGETVEPDKGRITIVGQLGDVLANAPLAINGHANGAAVEEESQSDTAQGYSNGHDADGAADASGAFVSKRAQEAAEQAPKPPAAPKSRVEDLPPPEPVHTDASLPKLSDLPPRTPPVPEAEPTSRLNGAEAPDRISTPLPGDSPAARAAAVDPTAPELASRAEAAQTEARKAAESAGDESYAEKRSKGARGLRLSDTLARIKTRTLGVLSAEERAELPEGALDAPAKPNGAIETPRPNTPAAAPDPVPSAVKPVATGRLLAKPNATPLPKPKLAPLPRVEIPSRGAAKDPVRIEAKTPSKTPVKPAVAEAPAARDGDADAMTVFGARGQTPPTERSRFLAPVGSAAFVVLLVGGGLAATYFLSGVADDWFGVGTTTEVTEIAEPPPLILPGTGGGVTDGPISSDPDASATALTPDESPAVSVPLPGLEITDLQPDTNAEPDTPAQPGLPEQTASITPGSEDAVPNALTEEGGDAPALAEVNPPSVDLAPPAAPELPPAPLGEVVEGPVPPDLAPNGTFAAPVPPGGGVADDLLDGLPGTIVAPDKIDLVALPEPTDENALPQIGLEAPPLARPTREPPPTEEEALAFYEETGISVLAPDRIPSPSVDRLTGVLLSDTDGSLADPKPRGLPSEETFDLTAGLPRAILPPLPLAFEFDLDERGLVRPSAEGTLSPRGVLVFRGTPAVIPPVRPGSLNEDTQVLPEPDAAPETDVVEGGPSIEDDFDLVDTEEGLAALLDDTDLAEAEERAQFGGLTLDELADVRPTARPVSTEAGEPAPNTPTPTPGGVDVAALTTPDRVVDVALSENDVPDTPVVDGADVGVETATPDEADPLIAFANVVPPARPVAIPSTDDDSDPPPGGTDLSALRGETAPEIEGATELAVTASLAPPNRPAGLDISPLSRTPDPTPTPEPNPPAPSTPETVSLTPAPNIPSSVEVASSATEENALRLNQVNLIGVYGSAENRRALVRLSNGRYVKVQVGDRVDRGTVVAIGEDALQYVRSGRTVTLQLPSG